MFAAITWVGFFNFLYWYSPPLIDRPMLAIGGFAERAHLGPLLVFVFLWATLVYDPIACWTWNSNGWSFKHGSYDFAGGVSIWSQLVPDHYRELSIYRHTSSHLKRDCCSCDIDLSWKTSRVRHRSIGIQGEYTQLEHATCSSKRILFHDSHTILLS